MKRLLTAFLIALGLHGSLLGMEISWLKRVSIKLPKQHIMTMTLAIRQPQTPVRKIVPKKLPPQPKAPLLHKATKKIQRIKNTPKPKVQKTVNAPVQPAKQDLPKAITKRPFDGTNVTSKSEQLDIKKITKAVPDKEISKPAKQVVRTTRPMYQTNPPPKYPEMARKRGFEGNVVLEVLVDRHGTVTNLRLLLSSGHPILDKAAMRSVKNWTFEPGMKGKTKVEMWVKIPIRFELK